LGLGLKKNQGGGRSGKTRTLVTISVEGGGERPALHRLAGAREPKKKILDAALTKDNGGN